MERRETGNRNKKKRRKKGEKNCREEINWRVESDVPVGIRGDRISAAGRRGPSELPSSAPG